MSNSSLIVSNIFIGQFEPMLEDHQVGCKCGDEPRHIIVNALDRGVSMRSGIKIQDITTLELDALISECRDMISFSSPSALEDEFYANRNYHYGLKRFMKKLLDTKEK
jgi:hypothetical protein